LQFLLQGKVMPRVVLMTWIQSQKRWTKYYKGQRYYVSAKALGCPPNQADSLLRANEWWRQRQAEVDGRRTEPGSPEALATLLAAWNGRPPETGAEAAEALASLVAHYRDQPLPRVVAQAALGAERVAQLEAGADRLLDAEAPPAGNSVGALAERWVQAERQRVRSGQVGADRCDSNRRCLAHFAGWLGADTPVDTLDEARWLEWHAFLAEQVEAGRWNVAHVNRIWAISKRFVRFCWELRALDSLPRNLDKRSLAFTVRPRAVEVFTAEELRALYAVVANQSRLHFLLMCNCGFLASDLNDLRQHEVDWSAGIITRRRTKTRHEASPPVVRYKLWPETFALLQKWRSSDPDIVLLTQTGGRWLVGHQGDVSFTRSDCVASALRVYLRRAGVRKPPKALRATAATALAGHPTYKFYAGYFLGHSPRGVAERHYIKPSDEEFFAALEWLRTALLPDGV
jgi:integrase